MLHRSNVDVALRHPGRAYVIDDLGRKQRAWSERVARMLRSYPPQAIIQNRSNYDHDEVLSIQMPPKSGLWDHLLADYIFDYDIGRTATPTLTTDAIVRDIRLSPYRSYDIAANLLGGDKISVYRAMILSCPKPAVAALGVQALEKAVSLVGARRAIELVEGTTFDITAISWFYPAVASSHLVPTMSECMLAARSDREEVGEVAWQRTVGQVQFETLTYALFHTRWLSVSCTVHRRKRS